jgi:hypothetical protein
MRKATKSTKSTSPKFKVGDIVWIPYPAILDSEDSICIIQTTITALVFELRNGNGVFSGYKLVDLPNDKCATKNSVFASKDECIAYLNETNEEL